MSASETTKTQTRQRVRGPCYTVSAAPEELSGRRAAIRNKWSFSSPFGTRACMQHIHAKSPNIDHTYAETKFHWHFSATCYCYIMLVIAAASVVVLGSQLLTSVFGLKL